MAKVMKEGSRVLITDEALYFFHSGIFLHMIDQWGVGCLKEEYHFLSTYKAQQILGFLYLEYKGKIDDLFTRPVTTCDYDVLKYSITTDAKNIIEAGTVSKTQCFVIGKKSAKHRKIRDENRLALSKPLTAEIIKDIESTEGKFEVIVATLEQLLEFGPDLVDVDFFYIKYPHLYEDNGAQHKMLVLKKEYQTKLLELKVTNNIHTLAIEPFGRFDPLEMAMG